MKRRALLVAGVGVLGGCLQSGAENTQGSGETDRGEDRNGTDQRNEPNGTDNESDSNATDQEETSTETSQSDSTNRSDSTNDSTETKETDTVNGTTQNNATNGSTREEGGNETDQNDARETRTYEIVDDTSPESPIQHEFEVTQPNIHSPDSPLTFTISIYNQTEETVTYGDTDSVVGLYLISEEFILVPPGKQEYSFDESERMWFATEEVVFSEVGNIGELEPDETRSQDHALIRRPHKEFPETVPSELAFSRSIGVGDRNPDGAAEHHYPFDFSLITTD